MELLWGAGRVWVELVSGWSYCGWSSCRGGASAGAELLWGRSSCQGGASVGVELVWVELMSEVELVWVELLRGRGSCRRLLTS